MRTSENTLDFYRSTFLIQTKISPTLSHAEVAIGTSICGLAA